MFHNKQWDSYLSANYAPTMAKCSGSRGWGGLGLSFTSPLTFCLPLDQASTSFQQRIKQLLTEEWRDWQVKSFLPCQKSLCVRLAHVFPELTFHIPAWLLNFSAVKCEGNFWSSTFHTVCLKMTPVHRHGGIKFLNKLAFECYVKFFAVCVPWTGFSHSAYMSSVHQRSHTYSLQQTLVSDEGIFSLSGTCGSR